MNRDIIMFDFDNTIVNSLEYWHKVLDKEMFIKYGQKPNPIMKAIRKSLSNKDMAEAFIELVGIKSNYTQIYQDWHELMSYYYTNKIKLIKGVKELLVSLKKQGKTLILASATDEKLLKIALKHFEIDIFDHIFTEYNVGYPKSDINFFYQVLEKLDTQSNKVTFFEDSFVSLKNASSIGINCYGLIHKFNKSNKKAITSICTKTLKNYSKLIKNNA